MSYPMQNGYGNNVNGYDMQMQQLERQMQLLQQRKQLEQQQMQNYQQPTYQQQPTQQQSQPNVDNNVTNANWITIKSIDEVTGIVVGQNQTRWFMFENVNVMGVKTVDNLGLPKVQYYKFEEYDPHEEQKKQETPIIQEIDFSGYVKEDDVIELKLSLESEISNLKKEIENLKTKDIIKPKNTNPNRKEVIANVE